MVFVGICVVKWRPDVERVQTDSVLCNILSRFKFSGLSMICRGYADVAMAR